MRSKDKGVGIGEANSWLHNIHSITEEERELEIKSSERI